MEKERNGKLYAIYKKGHHLGNERGKTSYQAIANYVIASQFEDFLDDTDFMSKYSAKPAKEGVHYTLSSYLRVSD